MLWGESPSPIHGIARRGRNSEEYFICSEGKRPAVATFSSLFFALTVRSPSNILGPMTGNCIGVSARPA